MRSRTHHPLARASAVAAAFAVAHITIAAITPTTTLRVVEYNIDDSDVGNINNVNGASAGIPTVLQGIGNHHIGSNVQAPDLIALTELLDTPNNNTVSASLPALVSALNSLYGAGTYAYDATPDPTTGSSGTFNGPSGLIYNTHTVQVISAIHLGFGSVNGASIPRAPMRYQIQPLGYGADAGFYMYVSHFKSGGDSASANARGAEGTEIRSNADTLGPNAHIIYTGDMNLFGDNADPGYTALTAAGNGQAHDPIAPANWTGSNATLAYLYTESTTNLQFRDDVQLVSNATLAQPGLQLASDTGDPFDPRNFPSAKYPYAMEVFGNNGSTALHGSTNLATNSSLNDLANASTVRADLMAPSGSDHLPIVADYVLAGVNPVAQSAVWLANRSGNWSTSGNWSPAKVPANSFPFFFNVTINSGNVTLDINAGVSSLALGGTTNNWTATLDLTTHKLVIQPDADSKSAAFALLQNQVASFGHGSAGGITSSALPSRYGIAVVDNAVTQFSSFGGQDAGPDSLLVAAELLGDLNLDGTVNSADLQLVLQHFGQATPNWTDGNFSSSATVDLNDLADVLNNIGQVNTLSADASVATPEAGTLLALATAIGSFTLRRRHMGML